MNIQSILQSKGLLIATHNKGKLKEIQTLLKPLGIRCTSAGERGLPEPEETEETFQGNAELKARAAAIATNMPTLSDDSGLAIPVLGGAPGVYSARWAGAKKDFDMAFERIKTELECAKAPQDAPAYFICALSLAIPIDSSPIRGEVGRGANLDESNKDAPTLTLPLMGRENFSIKTFIGRVDGRLSFPPRGALGFGYDPIFIKDGMTKTFAEISPEEKHQISHRADAFQKFLKGIE